MLILFGGHLIGFESWDEADVGAEDFIVKDVLRRRLETLEVYFAWKSGFVEVLSSARMGS